MRAALFLPVTFLSMLSAVVLASEEDPLATASARLAAEIATDGAAYADLRELTAIGPRLAGSEREAAAIAWAKAKLESLDADQVFLQAVQVPRWERGATERAVAHSEAGDIELKVTALGNSVGTPQGGLTAGVIEVRSLAEVERRRGEVAGKIVFYNRPMDAANPDPFAAYSDAVDQRSAGPSQAARYGAVAVLVRSMTTLIDDDHPHTGTLSYRSDAPMIPAAAVSTLGAAELSRRLQGSPELTLTLELSARRLGTGVSYNVVADWRGRERPEEIVAVGGHIDSWDLGTGAHDDGAGVVQSIEVLRALKNLGLRPRRTVRVVLFAGEESGGYGGREYARVAGLAVGERHILAIESDRGGYAPVGFDIDGDPADLRRLQEWSPYLADVHAGRIAAGGSGTDVEPLGGLGVPTVGYVPDASHYFDMHHSALDQLALVVPEELAGGAAAMGILAYAAAENGL
jgi:Zn-dependent M28 family amino/carboxypeptidase